MLIAMNSSNNQNKLFKALRQSFDISKVKFPYLNNSDITEFTEFVKTNTDTAVRYLKEEKFEDLKAYLLVGDYRQIIREHLLDFSTEYKSGFLKVFDEACECLKTVLFERNPTVPFDYTECFKSFVQFITDADPITVLGATQIFKKYGYGRYPHYMLRRYLNSINYLDEEFNTYDNVVASSILKKAFSGVSDYVKNKSNQIPKFNNIIDEIMVMTDNGNWLNGMYCNYNFLQRFRSSYDQHTEDPSYGYIYDDAICELMIGDNTHAERYYQYLRVNRYIPSSYIHLKSGTDDRDSDCESESEINAVSNDDFKNINGIPFHEKRDLDKIDKMVIEFYKNNNVIRTTEWTNQIQSQIHDIIRGIWSVINMRYPGVISTHPPVSTSCEFVIRTFPVDSESISQIKIMSQIGPKKIYEILNSKCQRLSSDQKTQYVFEDSCDINGQIECYDNISKIYATAIIESKSIEINPQTIYFSIVNTIKETVIKNFSKYRHLFVSDTDKTTIEVVGLTPRRLGAAIANNVTDRSIIDLIMAAHIPYFQSDTIFKDCMSVVVADMLAKCLNYVTARCTSEEHRINATGIRIVGSTTDWLDIARNIKLIVAYLEIDDFGFGYYMNDVTEMFNSIVKCIETKTGAEDLLYLNVNTNVKLGGCIGKVLGPRILQKIDSATFVYGSAGSDEKYFYSCNLNYKVDDNFVVPVLQVTNGMLSGAHADKIFEILSQ